MRGRIVFTILLLSCMLAGISWAVTDEYKELIMKFGIVPDAILNPPVEDVVFAEKNSLLGRFFSGNRSRPQVRIKVCYANQRVTLGAIELYNMDNETMYKTLSHHDIADKSGLMVTTGYLKSPLRMSESGCHFRSYGDLSDFGIIYCDYHGTLPDDQQELRNASGYIQKVRKTGSGNSMLAIFIILAIASVGVMIVLHHVLPKAPE